MFIYKITFPNNKIYIGQTVQKLKRRIYQHKYDALHDRDITQYSDGTKIGKAIRKYGLEYDWVEQLYEASSIDELNKKEEYYINLFDSTNDKKGYNIKSGGDNNLYTNKSKAKIGKATKERWQDPEIAKRMLEGQRKTVEISKAKKGEARIEREIVTCINCGKEFEALPSENRRCCSKQCAAMQGSIVAAEVNHDEYLKRVEPTKDLIYKWCIKNKDIILNCPMNKISTNLQSLMNVVGVSDWRTLTKVLNYSSRKEFLKHLQEYVKIYAEPDQK